MQDVLVGLIAIAVGAVFCFRGFLTMRIVIPIWGAFSGFLLGAGFIDAITDEGFLGSVLAWLVGFVVAMVFGLFAYLYYEVSVMIAMAAIGFTLGVGLMAALGVTWSWLVVLVGASLGFLLAIVAIMIDLPTILLVLLTALAGATIMVFGAMLLFGAVETADFASETATTTALEDDWWWYALYIVLAIVGMFSQVSRAAQLSRSSRDMWSDDGGRHLRTV